MIKVYRDGRVKLTGIDYAKAKTEQWEKQNKRCFFCGLYVNYAQAEAHHPSGRGMGGSKRDDREIIITHQGCHYRHHWKERDGAAASGKHNANRALGDS